MNDTQMVKKLVGLESEVNVLKIEEEILKEYYEALNEKQKIELNINTITKAKNELKDNLEQFEYSLKNENSLVNSKNKELHDLEIEENINVIIQYKLIIK